MDTNFVKFGHAIFELCERTNRQTDSEANRFTHYNTSQPSRRRSNK